MMEHSSIRDSKSITARQGVTQGRTGTNNGSVADQDLLAEASGSFGHALSHFSRAQSATLVRGAEPNNEPKSNRDRAETMAPPQKPELPNAYRQRATAVADAREGRTAETKPTTENRRETSSEEANSSSESPADQTNAENKSSTVSQKAKPDGDDTQSTDAERTATAEEAQSEVSEISEVSDTALLEPPLPNLALGQTDHSVAAEVGNVVETDLSGMDAAVLPSEETTDEASIGHSGMISADLEATVQGGRDQVLVDKGQKVEGKLLTAQQEGEAVRLRALAEAAGEQADAEANPEGGTRGRDQGFAQTLLQSAGQNTGQHTGQNMGAGSGNGAEKPGAQPFTSPLTQTSSAKPATPTPSVVTRLNTPFQQPAWTEMMQGRVNWMIQSQIKMATVYIDPPELGPVHIMIQQNGEQTQVSFQVQNNSVREALEQSAGRLRDSLSEQGFTQVDVNVSGGDKGKQEGHDGRAMGGDGEPGGATDRDYSADAQVDQPSEVTAVSSGLISTYA